MLNIRPLMLIDPVLQRRTFHFSPLGPGRHALVIFTDRTDFCFLKHPVYASFYFNEEPVPRIEFFIGKQRGDESRLQLRAVREVIPEGVFSARITLETMKPGEYLDHIQVVLE